MKGLTSSTFECYFPFILDLQSKHNYRVAHEMSYHSFYT